MYVDEEIPNGWSNGEYDESQDLSEWKKLDDDLYQKDHSWWWSWQVCKYPDGLWHWLEVDHDGWDGEKEVDELIDSSSGGFPTWQDAARWINENRDFD